MRALLWRDYLCPWCWLGRSRTDLMVELEVEVTQLPYDLHPEIPPEGRRVRPGGRLDAVFDFIEAECQQEGTPFRRPTRTPNTRRALEVAEIVRRTAPERFAALDDSLFRGHWVDGIDLGDPDVIDDLVRAAGADVEELARRHDAGLGTAALNESMATAREHGVAATPAWLVDDRLVIPGVQPLATIERWIGRLQQRA